MECDVTVIMPSLNVNAYIDQCVQSILSQTIFQKLEVLFIDAGSSDGTLEKLIGYSDAYENINLITTDIRSYGYQVNLGIKRAHGTYIAILETDDYVRSDMYEILFKKAVKYDLEYVKADYTRFVTLRNGTEIHDVVHMLSETDDRYDRVIDPKLMDDIYKSDYFLWKGIYKTSFLRDNSILLRETPGAAFQDIGFTVKTISFADRVMYIQDDLYRYRTDRPASSMNSGKALTYSEGEFKSLLTEWQDKLPDLKGVYLYLAISFVGNIKHLTDWDNLQTDGAISAAFEWIKETVQEAINSGIISKGDISEEEYCDFMEICSNLDIWLGRLKEIRDSHRLLADSIMRSDYNQIIIFGAGNYGKKCLIYLDNREIKIDEFIDNYAEDKKSIAGIPVFTPGDAEIDKKTAVIIANKNRSEDMRNQLRLMSIGEDQIFIWR